MITEDYVSFEVAKLLKEKGFDEPCECFYDTEHNDISIVNGWMNISNSQLEEREFLRYSAPTHQMAMKWLREKGIHMSIDTVISSSGNIYFNIDTYSEDSGWNHPVDFYDSYEEAVEVALKYALENLI